MPVSGVILPLWLTLSIAVISTPFVNGRELTLDQAIELALKQTARGGMIRGNLEVAQQYYSARRINMYLPEISIVGSLPAYTSNESYRPFRNSFDKQLYEERNLDFSSFIELKQSLFTGGSLTATANLKREDNRYPDVREDASSGVVVNENTRQGFFNFSLEQPLFRPSSVRNELNNRRDDLEIAIMTRIEEEAALKREVIEAYLGVLQKSLQLEIAADRLKKTQLKENIDSAKLADGVISEEDFLLSTSDRLDAELGRFEMQTQNTEQKRELATLLDLDVTEDLLPCEPTVPSHLDRAAAERMINAWEQTVPITKADHVFAKKKRAADYAAAGHGLTGDLKAGYNLGRQKIETERADFTTDDNINTSGWSVSLDFRLPVWDGGAGGAAVRAARYEAEQARYEFTRAQRSARAKIVNLINQLDVSYQRLEIIAKQIELAENRLNIARDRYADGQISRLTLLESRIFWLETRDKYLDELKDYLINRIELQSQFAGI
jgi:outer membrane protein TolC